MANPHGLTFVISTYNRASLIEAESHLIKELAKFADVMIIDDGSTDSTGDFLSRNFAGQASVTVVRNETNRGSAHCWNIGLAKARTKAVFLLHDDSIELRPSAEEFVRILTATLERYEIVGVHVDEQERISIPFQGAARDALYQVLYALAGQVLSRNYGRRKQCWFVSGILGVRTGVGLSLLFDDHLFTGNGFREESDFELRARKSGFRIIYDPALEVVHKRTAGGGQSLKSSGERYAFWAVRNQFIFMRKNGLRFWPLRFVLFLLYQAALHGASPRIVARAVMDGTQAIIRNERSHDGVTGRT